MILTYPEQLEIISLTKARLSKVRLYVAPAKPCNDNQSWDDLNESADNHNACLRLIDQVASSWQIRQASLLAAANRLGGTKQNIHDG